MSKAVDICNELIDTDMNRTTIIVLITDGYASDVA